MISSRIYKISTIFRMIPKRAALCRDQDFQDFQQDFQDFQQDFHDFQDDAKMLVSADEITFMQFNVNQTRNYLQESEFEPLFVEELGWEYHTQSLIVTVDDTEYALVAIAEKRVAYGTILSRMVFMSYMRRRSSLTTFRQRMIPPREASTIQR